MQKVLLEIIITIQTDFFFFNHFIFEGLMEKLVFCIENTVPVVNFSISLIVLSSEF